MPVPPKGRPRQDLRILRRSLLSAGASTAGLRIARDSSLVRRVRSAPRGDGALRALNAARSQLDLWAATEDRIAAQGRARWL